MQFYLLCRRGGPNARARAEGSGTINVSRKSAGGGSGTGSKLSPRHVGSRSLSRPEQVSKPHRSRDGGSQRSHAPRCAPRRSPASLLREGPGRPYKRLPQAAPDPFSRSFQRSSERRSGVRASTGTSAPVAGRRCQYSGCSSYRWSLCANTCGIHRCQTRHGGYSVSDIGERYARSQR